YADLATGSMDDPGYSSYYYQPAPADNRVHLTVTVPADAQVWVEDAPTTSNGTVRQFVSPPLEPGGPFTYHVRARWNENGQEVTRAVGGRHPVPRRPPFTLPPRGDFGPGVHRRVVVPAPFPAAPGHPRHPRWVCPPLCTEPGAARVGLRPPPALACLQWLRN